MSKTVPCFICRVPVVTQSDQAIAKLCPEHDTEENRKKMSETPIRQLQNIQIEGVRAEARDGIKDVLTYLDGLKQQINNLEASLKNKAEVSDIPTKSPTPPTTSTGNVNEFGEII